MCIVKVVELYSCDGAGGRCSVLVVRPRRAECSLARAASTRGVCLGARFGSPSRCRTYESHSPGALSSPRSSCDVPCGDRPAPPAQIHIRTQTGSQIHMRRFTDSHSQIHRFTHSQIHKSHRVTDSQLTFLLTIHNLYTTR